MDDVSQFIRLIRGNYSCISIVTHEEFEALDVIRRSATRLEYKMQMWSAGSGVRDGLHPMIVSEPKLKSPEAGLKAFALGPTKTIYAMLDLVPYLQSAPTLRAAAGGDPSHYPEPKHSRAD